MKQILEKIIMGGYDRTEWTRFFREKNENCWKPAVADLSGYNTADFSNGEKIGEYHFEAGRKIIVSAFFSKKSLSERGGKKVQYEIGRDILKKEVHFDAGIFIFRDESNNFRFSYIETNYLGTRRDFSHFRRFTYFVSKEFTNKTFLLRVGDGDFGSVAKIKDAFSITAVTDLFYDDFFKIYGKIVASVKKANDIKEENVARDFVLLFAIRTVFIGFIQKKKWLGEDEKFIQNFFNEYKNKFFGKNEFYPRWLTPLFFEALNSPQGRKVAYGNNDFSKETELNLQMAPYLNGGLFKQKRGYDNYGWIIGDKEIEEFFDFLFAHSFTIEENSLEDEDLQLNPGFLGIIFERLVNKANGAVYTPRTEVDLMCRLSLVKWLQKNLENPIQADNLYELFFKESKKEEEQKEGSFSQKEAEEILNKLENLAICDPAVGSGAFLVGMMQVLDEIEQTLKNKYNLNGKNVFERKKEIIKQSLYGVEIKEWAVWICQLRLWLSLFVDAPDELKNSFEPILPSLDFKVRQGDSLVQRVGSKSFPVSGHNLALSKSTKDKITKLKNLKLQYFDNRSELKEWELKEKEVAIYEEILSEEIKDKENSLQNLKNIKPLETAPLFGEREIMKQEVLELNKEKIEELENEIKELKEQKIVLRKDKLLVWSIEFAEVFAEKGGFDIVIGNPPYVRQEAIADPTGKIKNKKEYKNYLEEMVKMDFPNDFPPKAKINAQSDLYAYFYIRGLRLLNPQGVHTFICSNSWLDVGYGVWLQNFLLKRAPAELIIDNHAKRSFGGADVNTIISIIHAPQKKLDENKLVKFTAFKKPFEEAVFTENFLMIENAKKVESNDIFRVYPLTIKELREAGTEYENEEQKTLGGKYVGDKWGGKYLRAPDIFFTILEKGKDKLVKLGDIAEVRRGFTTGANEFFYLTDSQIKQWGIEEEFLKPVIKSPRECKNILVNPKDLKYKIFICNKSKEELKGTNALKYIEWGERQKTEDGILWENVPSVSGRKHWYSLGERIPARINFNYLIYEVGNSYLGEIFVSDNFHEIHTDKQIEIFLNSIVFYLFQLNTGRVGFGGGLLKIQTYELANLLTMELEIGKTLKYKNSNHSIFEECGIDPKSETPIEEQEPKPLPDRAELDKIVFDALGLTDDERKEVYRAVCRLVWNRISKAKSM